MDVDAKTTKLSEMRDRIEFNRSGHMNRRTLLFQEALFIMSRLPNYYDRPKSQLTRWQFGYVKKGSDNVKMIHPEAESQTLFAAVPDLFSVDVVIVPLSQVPPEFDSMPPPAGDSAAVDNGGAPAGTENAHNEND